MIGIGREIGSGRASAAGGWARQAALIVSTLCLVGASAPARGQRLSARLARESRFRRPTPEEARQLQAALTERGWGSALVARVPTSYSQTDGQVQPVGFEDAYLYGNLDEDEQPEWVMGCYFPPRPAGAPDPDEPAPGRMSGREPGGPTQDDRARIVVFKKESSGPWRATWRSPGLGFEFAPPRYNLREVEHGLDRFSSLRPPLCLVDIDGDRRLEIASSCSSQSPTVGMLPGVYRCERGRWASIAPQADRFCLRDVDRDGTLEWVTASRFIGYGTGDDDVPRVWRWKSGVYQEASGEFSHYYSDLAERYAAHRRRMEDQGEKFDPAVWDRAIQKATSFAG